MFSSSEFQFLVHWWIVRCIAGESDVVLKENAELMENPLTPPGAGLEVEHLTTSALKGISARTE